MANKYRHRFEEPKKRTWPVIAAVETQIGDLVWWDSANSTIKPASDYTYGASLAVTQEGFAKVFAGLCTQHSGAANADNKLSEVSVDSAGVKEFACAAATFDIGDLVGMDDNAGGTALEDQQVIAVTDPRLAIGRVARRYSSNTTSVLVEIFPPKAVPPSAPLDYEFWDEHTTTSGEDTAGAVEIDTGFGAAPTHVQVTILAVTTGALRHTLAVTFLSGADAGKVSIADNGGETIDQGDVIYLYARK